MTSSSPKSGSSGPSVVRAKATQRLENVAIGPDRMLRGALLRGEVLPKRGGSAFSMDVGIVTEPTSGARIGRRRIRRKRRAATAVSASGIE